ncbi:putative uncharacterized transposon-derived protein F54H12.3 [Anolis carolinensis]|uniref:Integrase catalytic domain-containing protein n=1 Tax=Anolis carolinensis TaxID=28377 RepID=A0A803TEK9_ANOCA
MSESDEILKKIYFSPGKVGSLGGVWPLFQEAKKQCKTVRKGDVTQWLSKQDSYTLHRPARIHFKRNKTIVSHVDSQWQADLVDMQRLSKFNRGYKYILTVIDILSKYAWGLPLKDKSGREVSEAFNTIFTQDGRKPEKLQTDRGREFLNKAVSTLLKHHGVHHFVTNNEVKAGVVERFNRTLKTKMWRYFTAHNTFTYIDVLPMFLKSYNHSFHHTIKTRPVDVNDSNALDVWRKVYGPHVKRKEELSQFRKGDHVRISKSKGKFAKGYEQNFTSEIFIVDQVLQKTSRPVFLLKDYAGEDVIGTFYPEELQKINTDKDRIYRIEKILATKGRGARKQCLVKWLGWPSKFNSWVLASEVTEPE